MGGKGEDDWSRGVGEARAPRRKGPRPQGGNSPVDSEASGGRAPPTAAVEELQGVGAGRTRAAGLGRGFGNHQARPGQLQPRRSTCL